MKAHTVRPLYRELASAIQARKNCIEHHAAQGDGDSNDWKVKWEEIINKLSDRLPSGSGINGYQAIDLDKSHAEKLVIHTQFHHMNDNGFYDGWTGHTITVTPSFTGINLRISGPNRNDIKDYLYETFDYALTADVTYYRFVDQYPELKVTSKWEDKDGSASQCYQAWYSPDGFRFWNDFNGAMNRAADMMEEKFYTPKVGA